MENNYFDFYQNYKTALAKLGIDEKLHFRDLYNIVSLKVSMFKYEDLPSKSLLSENVETALLFSNHLCWAKISATQEVVLCRYNQVGEWDIYANPTQVNLIAFNGANLGTQNWEDIVLFKDNPIDTIPYLMIKEYVDIINETENTLMVNMNTLRLPLMFICSPQNKATVNAFLTKMKRADATAVICDKSFANNIQTADIKIPISPLDIYEIRNKYKQELLVSLGIYAVDEKRERLVTAEVSSRNDYADLIYTMLIDSRRQSIEKVNKKFGTNIKIVESYDTVEKDKFEETYITAKAQSKGELDGNPKQFENKGGNNNEFGK